MSPKKRDLPEFNRPPVVEVVLGVQFMPLGLSLNHYGLFFGRVRQDYPKFVVQPPLPSVIEGFGVPKQATVGVELAEAPEIRAWYIDASETRLIQVQKDRFLFNWRKVRGDEIYPRYHGIEPVFEEEWKRFGTFLSAEQLGIPEVNQCEVTYVNHIEMDHGWKGYGELGKVLASWSGDTSDEFLPEPERVMMKAQYVMGERRGRLRITVKPAIRRRDGKEILIIELTARGKPNSSQLDDIVEWFELGHQWIVKGFTSFTGKQMHQIWERTL